MIIAILSPEFTHCAASMAYVYAGDQPYLAAGFSEAKGRVGFLCNRHPTANPSPQGGSRFIS
jgi:hypothetical protein